MSGSYKAVLTGGAVTGFDADVIIIDDLMKAADARSEPTAGSLWRKVGQRFAR